MAMTQGRYEDSLRFHEMPQFNEIKHVSSNRGFRKVCEMSSRNPRIGGSFKISFSLVDFPLIFLLRSRERNNRTWYWKRSN